MRQVGADGGGAWVWLRSLKAWVLMSLVVFPLSIPIMLLAPLSRLLSQRMTRLISRGVLWAVGADFRVVNLSGSTPPPGGSVYIANHQSYLDVVSLITAVPHGFRFLAKRSLLFLPGINFILLGQRHFLVSHRNLFRTLRMLRNRAPEIIESGDNLFVFPEGGRNLDGRPGEFKDGAAALAIWAEAPLVPVALMGTHKVLPRRNWPVSPGPITVVIGEPVSTSGLRSIDRKRLTADAREWIIKTVAEYENLKPAE